MKLGNLEAATGQEPFVLNGMPTGRTLYDFWRWSASELNDNLMRAALGEFIVRLALGERCLEPRRAGWRVYDLLTRDGCKIEVKTSAKRQAWAQRQPSRLVFDISRKADWEQKGSPAVRHADVYVFCIFDNENVDADPLELTRWRFLVVATRDLDERVDGQRTISVAAIEKKLPHIATDFAGLNAAISCVCPVET